MKKFTCIFLALILTTALLSACGSESRDDLIGTDTAPSIDDIQPTDPIVTLPDTPETLPESDAPITMPEPAFDAGKLQDNLNSIERVKFIEDGYVYHQCWLTDSEISAFIECLSKIDVSEYETVDWKAEEIPDEGYWMYFIFTAGEETYRVCPHWCLSINGVGYKWEYDDNYHELYSLAEQIRDSHEDWSEVTDDPSEFENTAAVSEDEELRYDVESVKFRRLYWEYWFVEDYYLTNSEINEFLDALTSLDFSEEYNDANLGGETSCIIKTDSESYGFSLSSPYIYVFPDDSFSLESRYQAKNYRFDKDSKVFTFVRELSERVVRADLDAKYRSDRS